MKLSIKLAGADAAVVTSLGFNLCDQDSATAFAKKVADLKLGPLADHGGPTPTHALLHGSPAINAGDPAATAGFGAPIFDQRGYSRIGLGVIDIGAFEVGLEIHCPGDLAIECGRGTTPAKTGSATARGEWGPVSLTHKDAASTPVDFPPPVKFITRTWTATDRYGNHATCEQHIDVVDTKAPVIHHFAVTPAKLSPANGQMVTVKLDEVVEDSCATVQQVKRTLTVKVSDPAGPDGKSYFNVKNSGEVQLRAKKGVAYTLTLTCTDPKGNQATKSLIVPVK